jgi:hypothetical protein
MKTLNDVYGNGCQDFMKTIRCNGSSVSIHYIINPNRITIFLPAYSVPEVDGYIGYRRQDCISFRPERKEIIGAIKAAKATYGKDYFFGGYVNKIIDISIKTYEHHYGTIRI